MGKTVQIRDLNDTTYDVMIKRAKSEGLSLSQYLRKELDGIAQRASWMEIIEEADARRARGAVVGSEALRAAREADVDDRR
jgi:antitoxin FitA